MFFLTVLAIIYVHMGIMLDHLLFNESLLHYLSIICVTMIVFCVCMNESVHLLYLSIYFCSWQCYLWWALVLRVVLFSHLHYYGGCQYVKGTKQILIAQCVVECSCLHSDFLVCEFQMYTVHFTGLFCKGIYRFSVFFTTLFWQPQLPK